MSEDLTWWFIAKMNKNPSANMKLLANQRIETIKHTSLVTSMPIQENQNLHDVQRRS